MYITEITPWKKGRLLVHTDTVGTFPIYGKEIAAYQIEEGSFFADDDWERFCEEVLQKRVIRRAMYLLQKKDYTEAQLRKKLAEGYYPPALVDAALDYVKSFHYIDDLRYAGAYIRYHQSEKSRLQLRSALKSRGVSDELIEQAMAEDYENNEEFLIQKLLLKKRYDADSMDQKEKYKIYQYLMRKGFAGAAVRKQMGL